jgi:hypothetical protein
LFYFQIASLFTYMTTRMNEWTTTHTTAAASSIDVRVSDLGLFYFGSFNLFVIILLYFICIMFYFGFFFLQRPTFWCIFFVQE